MSDGESVTDFDSRPEAIRRTIEARIIDGKMQPGDRLGLKADLQKEFDVAGPTIAQALTLLTNDGLISMRRGPGGGIFVERSRPDSPRRDTAPGDGHRAIPRREHRDPRIPQSAAGGVGGQGRQPGGGHGRHTRASSPGSWSARHPPSTRNA